MKSVPSSQDFILPALLYLTAVRPRRWVWVLNISIAILYACVAVVGAVGAFKLIIEVGLLNRLHLLAMVPKTVLIGAQTAVVGSLLCK